MTANVVGRLAPSPTGHLHLGHARSFLLAYWSARQQGGRLLLRLEDLDGERAAQPFVDATLRDLEWLGLDWDGTPRLQSAGLSRIRELALSLQAEGRAYACTCTRADLRAALSAPQQGSRELRYSGRCRGRYADLGTAVATTGKGASLRFRVDEGTVVVEDRFAGQRSFDVSADCGDFLILRRDQIPSYQLAVVVDDAVDSVTEVVRGDDLLPSAARQQLLNAAFGYRTPAWIHVPLVVDEQGQRFAKRTDSLSLRTLRERGIEAGAIVGWVARHSGWPELDQAKASELISSFSWARVPVSQVVVPASVVADLES